MAEKKKQAEPSDAHPASVLAKALEIPNRYYNDQQNAAVVEAAEALLDRASVLGDKYPETLPPEYVAAAIKALREACSDIKALTWTLKVRAAKALMKYGVPLKDEK